MLEALAALYENEIPVEPVVVDLADAPVRADFLKLWPIGKFPVLRGEECNLTILESSIIIEYLAQHYPGRTALVPKDPDLAREVHQQDRFFDLYVHDRMQKIGLDTRRPAGERDAHGVLQAKAQLGTASATLDSAMSKRHWAAGEKLTMADCAAMPALHYANRVLPHEAHGHLVAYLRRLEARPSFARVLVEAAPFFAMFPG